MEPAFSTRMQGWLFCALLAFLLVLPWALPSLPGYRPEQKFHSAPSHGGHYQFMAHSIFEETGDIDLLVLGSSYIWNAVNTDLLAETLVPGKKLVTLNLGANWRGEDLIYLLLKELLQRRRVHTVVIDPPEGDAGRKEPHYYSLYWWIAGEHIGELNGLDLPSKFRLWAYSYLGAPRHVLGLLRNRTYLINSFVARLSQKALDQGRTSEAAEACPLGTSSSRARRTKSLGFLTSRVETIYEIGSRHSHPSDPTISSTGALLSARTFPEDPSFQEKNISTGATGTILSPATQNNFSSLNRPLPPYDAYFFAKAVDLALTHGTKVVLLDMPRFLDRADHTIVLRQDWRRRFPAPNLFVAGVVPADLFSSLSEDEVRGLYYDVNHFNINGARLFTRAVTPTLAEIYGTAPSSTL
ncbi:MAG: hypothetical protein HYR96_07415 [Deltaproteobacteria bacterium]|nr:hypothetical protein [Deltaproteobacteria bacterium]MBI3294192.1 hypothetical protein [Deltaproteobacteria bacterium]